MAQVVAGGAEAQGLGGHAADGTDVEGQVRDEGGGDLVATASAALDVRDRSGLRGAAGVVADDGGGGVAPGGGVDGGRAVGTGAEPVVARGGVGLDDDVVALGDGDLHDLGLVRLDGDQVGTDDGELVAVDGELKVGVGSDVDHADQVLLAGLKDHLKLLAAADTVGVRAAAAVEGVGAVDEGVLGSGRGTLAGRCRPALKGRLVEVVLEEEHTHVDVIVVGGRSVDDHRTEHAIGSLQGKVRVVPGAAVLGGAELVGERLARGDGALGDTRNTIILDGVALVDTVPVDGGAVGLHVVGHVDDEIVTPVGGDQGAGGGAVDGLAVALVTIGVAVILLLDGEPVLPGDSSVRDNFVEVGVYRVFSPALPRVGAVLALLTRRERVGKPLGRNRDGLQRGSEGSCAQSKVNE